MSDNLFERQFMTPLYNGNLLNDRLMTIDSKSDMKSLYDDLEDRMIDVKPMSDLTGMEEFFREMNKGTTKKIPLHTSTIGSNNSRIANSNNMLAMKMVTYYQFVLPDEFVCSPISLLIVLLLFYLGLSGQSKDEIENA